MAVKFNRIINLYFLNAKGIVTKKIITPVHGRKPSITLSGQYAGGSFIPAFNITIKNLYLDLSGNTEYKKLKVEAGYQNNLISFTGNVVSIGIEQPGPEGSTVIQCQQGTTEDYLSKTINTEYKQGTNLLIIMADLTKKLGLYRTIFQNPEIQTWTLPEAISINGTVNEAIQKIKNIFSQKNLAVTVRNEELLVYQIGTTKTPSGVIKEVKFLQSPPQQNVGSADGANYTEFMAPWLPGLTPGDYVRFPVWAYIKYFNSVNSLTNTNIMNVTKLVFNFSTTGGNNQMTVGGTRVGGIKK